MSSDQSPKKFEGGVEGHADPASGGKCLDVKAIDPRGNIDGDTTCVVRQAAGRQKANGAGIKPGPSDPTPPDRREAIARIIELTMVDDIPGVDWSRFEKQRREAALAKADRILALLARG